MKWIKRILLGVLLFLLLAIIGLWIAGMRSDRGHFETSIIIDRPITDVYNALTDPEMTKRWVSGLDEIQKLTPGKTHVGSKLLLIEHINGQKVTMDEEITLLDPPNLVKYTTLGLGEPSSQFTEFGEYRLEEVNGKTKFTMNSQMEYHGFLFSFLEPILTPAVCSKFAGDQITLKNILEGNDKSH
jgi:uncharacterized protein YndB with AHSA1/START domain